MGGWDMRVLCVDGDERSLEHTLALCRSYRGVDEVIGVSTAKDAVEQIRRNHIDFALVETTLPDRNGIELAAELRERQTSVAIVFLTEKARYALDAYAVHPQSYLLKPLNNEALDNEITYFLLSKSLREVAHIEVKTFGNFEITVDGTALAFKRSKSKELLALLVDKQGAGISRMQAATEMWEDREYDRSLQKYFDNILASLMETLRKYNIGELMEVKSGMIRIRPELIDCDRYRFTMGDANAINAYQGIYMYGYSWASWNGGFFD